MEGSRACQLPMIAVRLLFQRHAAKRVMSLFHVSLRTARRYLAKGFVPDRIAAWALPIMDEQIKARVAKLEALEREIERAEALLGLRPAGLAAGGAGGLRERAALSAQAPED